MNIPLLSRYMQTKGWRQVDLARAANQLNPATMSLIFNGVLRPGSRLIERIRRGLIRLGFEEKLIESILSSSDRNSS